MEIEILKKALYESYKKLKENWDVNKYDEMCVITSLIVNDYFIDSKIAKIEINNISHYFNIINNAIVDLTKEQFNKEINYENYQIINRENILNKAILSRYNLLKNSVIKYLLNDIDQEINLCNKCQNLVEKFPNIQTVHLGKNNDIVLIGEAPANNGWRVSKMLWKNMNGKILPSGVVLQKLFNIIDKDIFDITFIESIKCYPCERKNIKTCGNNCKKYLTKQLDVLKPKIIITLGDASTRNVLNIKFNKFSDVVGKIYEINNYKVIPIYHPSPISPKSYKDNIPIFESLKDIL